MPNESGEQFKEIMDAFDKLPVFSNPIPANKDGVLTFVVDISIVKNFLLSSLLEVRNNTLEEAIGAMKGAVCTDSCCIDEVVESIRALKK